MQELDQIMEENPFYDHVRAGQELWHKILTNSSDANPAVNCRFGFISETDFDIPIQNNFSTDLFQKYKFGSEESPLASEHKFPSGNRSDAFYERFNEEKNKAKQFAKEKRIADREFQQQLDQQTDIQNAKMQVIEAQCNEIFLNLKSPFTSIKPAGSAGSVDPPEIAAVLEYLGADLPADLKLEIEELRRVRKRILIDNTPVYICPILQGEYPGSDCLTVAKLLVKLEKLFVDKHGAHLQAISAELNHLSFF